MRILKTLFGRSEKSEAAASAAKAETIVLEKAKASFAAGQFDLAHSHCRDALAQTPGNIDALELAFRIAIKRRVYDETITWLNAVADMPSALPSFMLGKLHMESGNLQLAGEYLRTALARDPKLAKAHNSLGAVLQIQGNLEEALACYQTAYAIDPTLWRASYNIANIHKLRGQFELALEPFQRALHARHGLDIADDVAEEEDWRTTSSKLTHDIEQLDYLMARGIGGEQAAAARQALQQVLMLMEPEFAAGRVMLLPQAKQIAMPYYNRLTNFYNAPALPGGALNQDQDWAAIEAAYFANAPGMTFMDNFLKPEALESLRRFCLESTIWFDTLYGGGYVGCTCEDGFICPLLVQIAEEQRLALPRIFGDDRIRGLWGYKYDSRQSGISVHADFAAVNVNFWLAPDDANLDPNHGGLVIWDKEAPQDWDFDDYNNNVSRIQEFLQTSDAKPMVVPHRQNRVVLFNSDLFHRTDDYSFKPGYENRRINVTMLYGDRRSSRN
jgi:tetratricopeptide (TPR) repeat protein